MTPATYIDPDDLARAAWVAIGGLKFEAGVYAVNQPTSSVFGWVSYRKTKREWVARAIERPDRITPDSVVLELSAKDGTLKSSLVTRPRNFEKAMGILLQNFLGWVRAGAV